MLSTSPFMQSCRKLVVDRLCEGRPLRELLNQDRIKNDDFDFDLTDQLKPVGHVLFG